MNASPMATGKLNGATSDNCAGRPARQQAQVLNVELIEGMAKVVRAYRRLRSIHER